MEHPNLKLAVPFFLVTDMEKSLDFYVNGLGFTLTNQWTPRGAIEWCWLTRDLVSLMLQEPHGKDHIIHTTSATASNLQAPPTLPKAPPYRSGHNPENFISHLFYTGRALL